MMTAKEVHELTTVLDDLAGDTTSSLFCLQCHKIWMGRGNDIHTWHPDDYTRLGEESIDNTKAVAVISRWCPHCTQPDDGLWEIEQALLGKGIMPL